MRIEEDKRVHYIFPIFIYWFSNIHFFNKIEFFQLCFRGNLGTENLTSIKVKKKK